MTCRLAELVADVRSNLPKPPRRIRPGVRRHRAEAALIATAEVELAVLEALQSIHELDLLLGGGEVCDRILPVLRERVRAAGREMVEARQALEERLTW